MHIDYIAQIDSYAASGNIPATSYYRFVTVRVANVASIALIDSGNSWRNVISVDFAKLLGCLLYTSPSPRDKRQSRMPSSA